MSSWEWEDFERRLTPTWFRVSGSDCLRLPIDSFSITRNDKRQIVLSTLVTGEASSVAIDHPAGTVRRLTETVSFEGHPAFPGQSAVGRGVIPRGYHETHNHDDIKETRENATLTSLDVCLRPSLEPAFTIDWIENLDTSLGVWSGAPFHHKSETSERLALGSGTTMITLIGGTNSERHGHGCLELTVGGVDLLLYAAVSRGDENQRRGCILYRGDPGEDSRHRIREVISFCLGNYLIYLGCSRFSAGSELLSLSAVSAHGVGVRGFDTHVLPPAPLGRRYKHEVDPRILGPMANAIYAHYDELDFTELSWSYWHAAVAPTHMAAAHYGAALEALQRSLLAANPAKFRTKVVEDTETWESLQSQLQVIIDAAPIDSSRKRVLRNKVSSNLNQLPQSLITKEFAAPLGLVLSPVEERAWANRNRAAHGSSLKADRVTTIKETKVLKTLIHRLVLKITGASDQYHDYYTQHFPVRHIDDPAM
jgi:hypothetical protein